MSVKRSSPVRGVSGLVAVALAALVIQMFAEQGAAPGAAQTADAAVFQEFSDRVRAYVRLQQAVESSLPTLKPTDLPEMITAHQEVLARKIREARPHANTGDIFTPAICGAFRRASLTALKDLDSAESGAYMRLDAADPGMSLTVNGIYPDSEPITALPPTLLAAFPALPVEVAYRIVGRTLTVIDVESRLIVDLALLVLPPVPPGPTTTPVTSAPARTLGDASSFAFPLEANSVRLAVIGDMGTGEQPQMDVAQQMVTARAAFPFDFVITVGDNIYTGSRPSDFEKAFAVPYKPLLDDGVRFYATLGNHDKTNQRFSKPFNMNGATYYTYRKGHVRFFAMDSNYMDRRHRAWVEKQLQEAGNGHWKICYLHHPLYSSGERHGSAKDLRKVLEPLFVQYGVDVVFAGHDHAYERVHPQKGIYYFTAGASGSLRVGGLASSAITAKGFDTDRSFMLIEIAGDRLYFQAISRTGVVVDSGVIQRTIRTTPATGAQAPRTAVVPF